MELFIFFCIVAFALLICAICREVRACRKVKALVLIHRAIKTGQLVVESTWFGVSGDPKKGHFNGTLAGQLGGRLLFVSAYYDEDLVVATRLLTIDLGDRHLEWAAKMNHWLDGEPYEAMKLLDAYAIRRGLKSFLPSPPVEITL